MKPTKLLLTLCLAILMLTSLACSRFKGESKEAVASREVKAAITDMISLVEQNQAKQMLEKYALPTTLEQMKSQGNLDRFADAFNGPIHAQVLEALKTMQAQTPTWNADFTEATFQPTTADAPPVVFRKINDRWHVVIQRPGQ